MLHPSSTIIYRPSSPGFFSSDPHSDQGGGRGPRERQIIVDTSPASEIPVGVNPRADTLHSHSATLRDATSISERVTYSKSHISVDSLR
jgi:hypothetical protein